MMPKESLNTAVAAMFPMISGRLKEAHSIADAAAACAATGNHDGALRILLDIEEITTDAITLLNAASLLRRERED
jgi:hypothetical protein